MFEISGGFRVTRMASAFLSVVAFALILATTADPARGSTFSAFVIDAAPGGLPDCAPLGPSPASGSWTTSSNGSGSSSAIAAAAPSALGGAALAISSGTVVGATNNAFACFGAEVVIDDVVISGPGPTATIQVTADLSGVVDLSALNPTWGIARIYATVQVGEDSGSGFVYSSPVPFEPSFTADTNTTIDTTLTSLPLTVSTSSTIAVRLFVAGSVIAFDNLVPGSGSASLDASNGLRFPSTGPVFILPAGFTADSVDANIVANQLVAPPAAPGLPAWGRAILVLTLLAAALRAIPGARVFRHSVGV